MAQTLENFDEVFNEHNEFHSYLTSDAGHVIRDILFDMDGRISDSTASLLRSHIMNANTPVLAHTDTARLFYAAEMQRLTGKPALLMFA